MFPVCAPVICNSEYITTLALSNCSHAYDYDVEAIMSIDLKAGDEVVETREIAIPPHATFFESVRDIFPRAEDHLRDHGGIGLLMIRPINIRTFGGQFFHYQRATGQFSTEHTF